MLINNLLPVIAGLSKAPTPAERPVPDATKGNKVAFVVDIPTPKVQGDFDAFLGEVNSDAANRAQSFQLLLNEQQSATAANGNQADNISPFEKAAKAYTDAESISYFAKPSGIDLGTL
ncbi:MAG: hypothetical protein AB7G06_08090 [Bdellovibrionales bacterium]